LKQEKTRLFGWVKKYFLTQKPKFLFTKVKKRKDFVLSLENKNCKQFLFTKGLWLRQNAERKTFQVFFVFKPKPLLPQFFLRL